MRKLLVLLFVCLLCSNDAFSSPLLDEHLAMLRSKTLMKSELNSDQLVLTFPITWWFYNQTSDFKSEQALTENNTVSALSVNYTSRIRRGWNDWSLGKQITACVVGAAGAIGGAGWGAAKTINQLGWGAIPGKFKLNFR